MAGLQIFGPDGSVRLDTNTSITRVVGITTVSGTSSVSVPVDRAWFTILEENGFNFEECAYQFNISGNNISWSPYPPHALSPAGPNPVILYGAY